MLSKNRTENVMRYRSKTISGWAVEITRQTVGQAGPVFLDVIVYYSRRSFVRQTRTKFPLWSVLGPTA